MKKWIGILGVAAALAAGGSALADWQPQLAVDVRYEENGLGYAIGSVGATRNDGIPENRMECKYESMVHYTSCSFYDAQHEYGTCYSYDNRIQEALRYAGDAYLLVHWDSTGKCYSASVTVGSTVEPRKP
jgi:hypothetical protein